MKHFRREPPWYVAGLAFECIECGRCCMGPEEGYVWATEKELEAIGKYLRMNPDEFRRDCTRRIGRRCSLVEDPSTKDCIFLVPAGNGQLHCRIYPARPIQCRTWPFWKSNLMDPESWSLAGLRCPGINRGPLYSFADIEQQANATPE